MSRALRIDPRDGIHHVYSRGTKRWALFLDDVDRHRFLGFLDRICDRHDIEVIAFCLMDNHFHLAVRCAEGGISAALRDLKSLYARHFNDRHRSSGPLYEGRFGSKLVTSHRQLRQLVRYIHRNPYAIDLDLHLPSYQWCSHAMYLDLCPHPRWLRIELALPFFADYQRDIERPIASDSVQNASGTASTSVAQPVSASSPSLADILVAVARSAGCDLGDVHPHNRNGLVGVAILLAQEVGFTHAEISEPFAYRTSSAVASAALRTRRRVETDGPLAALLTDARDRLQPKAA